MAKILVLDDVEDALHLLRRILERKGHSVSIFTEEEDALDHARKNGVDVAILDIKLKKMSGTEVLAELKRINSSIKVIMLTGYPTMETARQSLTLGACEYCVKPIDKNELEEKVQKVLAQCSLA